MIKRPYNKLNVEDFNNIINIYYETKNIKLSFSRMSDMANVSERAFSRVLMENGVNTKLKNRYVIKNENYFDNIDTEDKAYFIGLLFADGYVGNNNEIAITLKNTGNTREVLLKLISNMESNIELTDILTMKTGFNTKSTFIKLSFSNIHINNALKNIGIGCHKEDSRLNIPKQIIDNKLESHFIRGLYDGDGGVGIKNKHMPTPQLVISFMGGNNLLKEIKVILESELKLNNNTIRESYNSDKIFELRYGGNKQVNRIKEYLYSNAHIYLSHKQI